MVKFQKNVIFSHFCLITDVLSTRLVTNHPVQTLVTCYWINFLLQKKFQIVCSASLPARTFRIFKKRKKNANFEFSWPLRQFFHYQAAPYCFAMLPNLFCFNMMTTKGPKFPQKIVHLAILSCMNHLFFNKMAPNLLGWFFTTCN